MNKERFVESMNEKYSSLGINGNFDFSNLVFKTSKMTVKCNHCGKENTKSALRHLECTCKCYSNLSQKISKDEFIERMNEKFGVGVYKFDKLFFLNVRDVIEVYCSKHEGYFKTTPYNMSRSVNGCNICIPNKKMNHDEFVYRSKALYPYLDFNRVDENGDKITKFVGTTKYIKVWCNRHNGIWDVYANTLLQGKNHCGICTGRKLRTKEQFVELASKIHDNKYDYSEVEYKNSEHKVKIICTECNESFSQQPKAHLSGRGCAACGKYGYQQNKPGYFYIQKLTPNDKNKEVVYKIGITGDLIRRIYEQSRHSEYEHEFIRTEYFEDGHKPLELETIVKRSIKCGMVTEDELSDGFSETISSDDVYDVHKIVNKFVEEM